MRQSRTVSQDHTVSWNGVPYRIDRHQVTRGVRGARVQIERQLDGSMWMHWRSRMLQLETCEPQTQPSIARAVTKHRGKPVREAWEKALARQRLQNARRQLNENYARLPNRPVWQAIKPCPPRTGGLL